MKMATHKHCIAFVIISIACSFPLLAKDVPFELTSDGLTKVDEVSGIAVARENAQIKYNGITIKADQIEYNPKSGEALLFKIRKSDDQPILIATLKINREEQE